MDDYPIIKELSLADLDGVPFKDFNRYQEVTKCWRNEQGTWRLKDIVFTENWDAGQYRFLVECLRKTVQTGGTVYGAFDQGKLIGFASLEGGFLGSRKDYLQLSSLHVSCEHRGHGIGKSLFRRIGETARRAGASRLYISAHSAAETQAFYQAMGCVDTQEIQAGLVAREPCDRQLECDLSRRPAVGGGAA